MQTRQPDFLIRDNLASPVLPDRGGSATSNFMRQIMEVRTNGPGLTEITAAAAAFLRDAGPSDGVLTLFVQHTSCSLLIQENADPDVMLDMNAFFRRLVPPGDDPSMKWLRHAAEGPDDMPAHLKAAMLPVSLSIPVADGRMLLGTWQGVFLFEHRDRPHTRRIVAHFARDAE